MLPDWLRVSGGVILAVQSLFVARIVYESTFLTCWNGPQMVGFALIHSASAVRACLASSVIFQLSNAK